MPYTKKEVARVAELYGEIEGRRRDEYSPPTYRDSRALAEMRELVMSWQEREALEDKILVLTYLADCYDAMCRQGISAGLYNSLVECYVSQGELDVKQEKAFGDVLYKAIRARNRYEDDNCLDLLRAAERLLNKQEANELYSRCIKSRRAFKNDPVEATENYLAIIDEVEQELDRIFAGESRGMGFCHMYWSKKAELLQKRGICWRSPSTLNPHMRFD